MMRSLIKMKEEVVAVEYFGNFVKKSERKRNEEKEPEDKPRATAQPVQV